MLTLELDKGDKPITLNELVEALLLFKEDHGDKEVRYEGHKGSFTFINSECNDDKDYINLS